MKAPIFMTGIICAALAISAVDASAKPGEHKRPNFSEMDADGSGEITLDELQARMQARFDAADTDNDGALSQAEVEAAAVERTKKRVAKMFERRDADGDGSLSLEESQGRRDPARFFARMDADNSGGISEEEFTDARKKMRKHRRNKSSDN